MLTDVARDFIVQARPSGCASAADTQAPASAINRAPHPASCTRQSGRMCVLLDPVH